MGDELKVTEKLTTQKNFKYFVWKETLEKAGPMASVERKESLCTVKANLL